MAGEGKTVCVTGASGFIASWLVKLLLQRGYTVKASVRNLNNPKKIEPLLALEGAEERLHLYEAELLKEGSFDSVIDGCEGVFHTASPVILFPKDPQTELIDPAVKGTLNVLGSCVKNPSVKRVVLTSSIGAVLWNKRPRSPDVIIDETWFSDPEYCEETKNWYVLSKTLAEQAAWRFANEKGIDMVTINPSMVIGPLLQPILPESVEAILTLLNGAQTFRNYTYGWVDVKNVAKAHIQVFEIPTASGRYCITERAAHFSEIVRILHKIYPHLPLPERCEDDKPFMPTYQVSKAKAKTLDIEFIPLEVNLKETIESLKEKNFISF